jgi:Glycosyl hydrolase catalytic core
MTANGLTAVAGQYGLRLRNAPRRDRDRLHSRRHLHRRHWCRTGRVHPRPGGQQQAPAAFRDGARDDRRPNHCCTARGHRRRGRLPSGSYGLRPANPGRLPHRPARQSRPHDQRGRVKEFTDLGPGIIKVLSFHSDAAIRRLAADSPDASWIVRAFLDFGGRNISPQQFVDGTLGNVQRALGALPGRDVVVELHNEPNVAPEGLGHSWTDGASFATGWLDLLARYRSALPGVRFIYPGLSPGSTVTNIKLDHVQFLEASRNAIDAADGLGIHIYWSPIYPLSSALGVVDDSISRVRFKRLWVTEASNNKAGNSAPDKAQQYLQCWQELQKRATVKGVTFFVASASNPAFGEEIWVGRGLGALVGAR